MFSSFCLFAYCCTRLFSLSLCSTLPCSATLARLCSSLVPHLHPHHVQPHSSTFCVAAVEPKCGHPQLQSRVYKSSRCSLAGTWCSKWLPESRRKPRHTHSLALVRLVILLQILVSIVPGVPALQQVNGTTWQLLSNCSKRCSRCSNRTSRPSNS